MDPIFIWLMLQGIFIQRSEEETNTEMTEWMDRITELCKNIPAKF